MNIPISGPRQPLAPPVTSEDGKAAGRKMLEDMQNRLQALEDVDNPDKSGGKISIENLLILALIQRSKNIGTFLGAQSERLNAMNNQAIRLKKKIKSFSITGITSLLQFNKALQDPHIKKALEWYNTKYLPALHRGKKLPVPTRMILTPEQWKGSRMGNPFGDSNIDLWRIRKRFPYPVIPVPNSTALKNIKAFRPDVTDHLGTVEDLRWSKDAKYIGLGYLARVDAAFHKQIQSIDQIFVAAGKPVPDIASIPAHISTVTAGFQRQLAAINQDSQDMIQDMTKTMHYATQYETIASNLIGNFHQEVMASVNRIVI